MPGLSWLCLLWWGAVRDLLTLPEHVYLGAPVSCHGRRSVCLSGGQETQETNDVNSVPLELSDYCPVPRPRHSLGLRSALTVDCGAQSPVLTFTLRLQGTHSSTGRCRAGRLVPPHSPVCHPSSYSLTSYCVPLLKQQCNAVSAAFISLKLRGPQKLSGPRVRLAKLIPSVCVESCTKETWESSNRDLRCSLKISDA